MPKSFDIDFTTEVREPPVLVADDPVREADALEGEVDEALVHDDVGDVAAAPRASGTGRIGQVAAVRVVRVDQHDRSGSLSATSSRYCAGSKWKSSSLRRTLNTTSCGRANS